MNLSDATGHSWTTAGQGFISPLTYTLEHPLQTIGVIAIGIGVAAFAPVAIPALLAGGTALGSYAVGTAGTNAYNAPDADTRDYYLGQVVSVGAMTAAGMKGGTRTFNFSAPETEGNVITKGIFYRSSSGTNDSLTPRPNIDTAGSKAGLSGWNDLKKIPMGKTVQVDIAKLPATLKALESPDGHISIIPKTQSQLNAWAATRGTGTSHSFTKAIQSARIKK